VTLSGSQFWIPVWGPYLDQNPNLASRIDISGHHFSAPLFIGPRSCRAITTFSGSQFWICNEGLKGAVEGHNFANLAILVPVSSSKSSVPLWPPRKAEGEKEQSASILEEAVGQRS